MCLIIHKPAGVAVPFALLESAWAENPDGAGIMYHSGQGTEVYKVTPGSWADPVGHLDKVLSPLLDREVGIHFRWRTHGPIDESNTHPVELPSGDGWIMHNGVIQNGARYTAKVAACMSDTRFYVSDALRSAPMADAEAFWNLVGQDVGSQNKLLLMDKSGAFLRINDREWRSYHGLRLSNAMSIPETVNYLKRSRVEWQDYARGGASWLDYSDSFAPDRESGRVTYLADTGGKALTVTSGPMPARKITRKERKVLNEILRVGTWEAFSKLSGAK